MKPTLAILIFAVFVHSSNAQAQRWLSYEETVELEGLVITEQKYGPPNFGENPKTDQKVTVPILILKDLINVRATPGDGINIQADNLRRVQLVFVDEKRLDEQLIGKDVIVKGKLFHSHTGHHYTDVLITVSSIEGDPDPCQDALSQGEINVCTAQLFRRSDKQLNEVYRRILADLKGADRTNLISAQRAWLKYRTANCWAERERFHGGSLAPTIEATCLQGTTDARTRELLRIYETEGG